MSRYSALQLICETGKIFFGHVDTITENFSFRHEKLSSIIWTPVYAYATNLVARVLSLASRRQEGEPWERGWYVTTHFQERRGAASLRHKTAPKTPFSCVNRRPFPCGFHAAARTIRYSVGIALKSFKFVTYILNVTCFYLQVFITKTR